MNPNSTQPEENLDSILKNVDLAEADGLRSMWNLAGEAGDRPLQDSAAAERVRANLTEFAAAQPKRRPRLFQAVPTSWLAIAAALLIGAVGATLWFRPVVLTSAPGMQLAVDLPDGSKAELNSGAQLTRPRKFGDTRSVELVGEAYFDVSKNAKPFIVKTFNADIRVLGTRFIVRSWPDSFDRRTVVTLEEGIVEIVSNEGGGAVTLYPGESRSISGGVISEVDSVQAVVAGAWRNNDLVFKNTRLGVVLEDVERRFDVVIELQTEGLRNRPVTVALRDPGDAETVVRDLSDVLGLQYYPTEAGFSLVQP